MRDTLAHVDALARVLTTGSGARLPYDELVLAVGARPRPVPAGTICFGDPADAGAVAEVVRGVRSGAIGRIGLTGADGIGWTLPMYELALGLVAERGPGGEPPAVFVVTPEERPLAVFGATVSAAVSVVLEQRGVRVLTAATVDRFEHGELWVELEGAVEVDAAIALPRLDGPAVAGVPHDRHGFVRVDEHSRVRGEQHLYAAGDMCADPIKQGGLAAQRADAAAAHIAWSLGEALAPEPFDPLLRSVLLTGGEPRFLRARVHPRVTGDDGADAISREPQWWPPAKIAARELAPYLAQHLLGTEHRPAVTTSRAPAPVSAMEPPGQPVVIRPLSELSAEDLPFAGHLGARLGEDARADDGAQPGFVIGAPAYAELCDGGDLRRALAIALADVCVEDRGRLIGAAALARSYVTYEPVPERLLGAIEEAYGELVRDAPDAAVTVSASFTEPELPPLEPGDDDVFRDVRGIGAVEAAVRHCWAALFDARRVFERAQRGLPRVDIDVAVVVQRDGSA